MATEDYWADPVIDRERTPLGLYFPTLDAVVSDVSRHPQQPKTGRCLQVSL